MAVDNGVFKLLPLALGHRWRTCIHVVSRNEIYLGGIDGIQRYNGNTWEWMLDTTNSLQDSFGTEFYPEYICKLPDGNLEFVSQRARSREQMKYYRWRLTNNVFTVVDTFSYDQKNIEKIRFGYTNDKNGNLVLSASIGGIYSYNSGQWKRIHEIPTVLVAGSENDLISALYWGTLWHFNGRGWFDLYPEVMRLAPDIKSLTGIVYVDGVVFIAIRTTNSCLILRGRQKED